MASIPGLEDEIVDEGRFIVPDAVEETECWYVYVQDDDCGKIPCSPSSLYPDWIDGANPDEDDLVTFQEAMRVVHESRKKYGKKKGLTGIMLALSAPTVPDLAVIDIDDCVDPDTGELSELASTMIEDHDNTFWEVSPSGTGLHGYYFDPYGFDPEYQQKDTLELYTSRGVTFTGRHVRGTATGIDEVPKIIQVYQREYNAEKTGDESSDAYERKLRSDVQGGEYLEEGMDVEEHTSIRGAGVDALSGRTEDVVEAMLEYGDDDAKRLYENGSDYGVWSSWTDDDGEPDRSRAGFSLMMKLSWWALVPDMFDFQLSQAELEEAFLASDIASRDKCARADYVSLTAYKALEKARRDYLD